ncbi:MAG: hydroxyisourate hydrolase [Deltaproteobacteria bacterium]|nr:hydroxyisourate hydrolase [Deltaproteobacteria bacterium]
MSGVTTHVLDTARGRPAEGVPIRLERRGDDGAFALLGQGRTDADGRLRTLTPAGLPGAGVYRLVFDTGVYFQALGTAGFYPEVSVLFEVRDPSQHHHVPLLLNPFGYSTYRGS